MYKFQAVILRMTAMWFGKPASASGKSSGAAAARKVAAEPPLRAPADRAALTAKNRLTAAGQSQLRLHTIVRLRWFAVFGQFLTVCFVRLVLGFPLPIGLCLTFIALSAWINVYLAIRFPAGYRLSAPFATILLAYDILQLAALLYLTGGLENPFTLLMMAPVTISAATLPPRNTILLGILAVAVTCFLAVQHLALPWVPGQALNLPPLYEVGILAAILSGVIFLALYAWRLSKEGRLMSAALAATELVLAREQKLHALDGLAAAAAHELGTPLATIALVTTELEREFPNAAMSEDLALLRSQAQRCREILRKLTQRPEEQDPLHATITVRALVEDAAAPHRNRHKWIEIRAGPAGETSGAAVQEPVGQRRPGMIFGLGNIVENAVNYATNAVTIDAQWTADTVSITIADDGPGFGPDIMESLGEPYITTRGSRLGNEASGMGLGFFIAKTLLERSGAVISLDNRRPPLSGAVVRVAWRRDVFESAMPADAEATTGRSPEVAIDALMPSWSRASA